MSHRRTRMNYKKTWSHGEVAALIAMYKSTPCLWDVSSHLYKDRAVRNHCLTDMALKFNTTICEITRKIHNLRSQFRNERQKMLKRKSLYGSHYRSACKWPHFDSLRFLKRSMTRKLRSEYSDLREAGEESTCNESPENLGGGTAEPTSTVNVKQEPVDISECEQDMVVVLMKDGHEISSVVEAHSSRVEQHTSKPEQQNHKPEAHCSKSDMHYGSNSNCKLETCCNKPESHFSRSESYSGKPEIQCGISDIHSSRSEIHNSRSEIHNNRPEIHINQPELHSSRSDAHCSRTEPFRLLKIEPMAERVNRRSDNSDTSPFMTPEVRRLGHSRNDSRQAHCHHRSESISSGHMDQSGFLPLNEVSHNGCKREKQWNEDDQYEIFGKFVAAELRSLNSDSLKKKMKRKIQRAILDVCEEEEL